MSSLPPSKLPQSLSQSGWKDVASVTYKLTENDMKLKNRQPWKFKKKYWKAEFFFVVKLGPADLRFQIVGKNGILSTDHDSLKVEYMDPSEAVVATEPSMMAQTPVRSNGRKITKPPRPEQANGEMKIHSILGLTKGAFHT